MKEDALLENSIMNFEFQIEHDETTHFHQDIELIYILDGQIKLKIGEESYEMKTDDVVIINSNKKHSYYSDEEVLIGYFHINLQRLSTILKSNQILFWCNSIIDKNEAYEELRGVVKQIFNQYFEKSEQAQIYLTSLYYQLLHVLVSNFLLKNDDRRFIDARDVDEERINEIVNYIHSNYTKAISLNELSESLFLSAPYLSKYIKKKLGSSFIEYVNNIRLFYALEDLLYTDKSITYVSLDNGFANTAAFNSVFKKTYHVTPSEYRVKMKQKENEVMKRDKQLKKELVIQKVSEFLESNKMTKTKKNSNKRKSIVVDALVRQEFYRDWNKMINIGPAKDLLRSDMQEHILLLKNELHFQYVRFWDLYSDELYLDEDNQYGQYNFDNLNKVLDFLVQNGLYPYIDLGYKPQLLYRTLKNPIIVREREVKFHSYVSFKRFINSFASHLTNRYGVEEIEHWYFEQWYDYRFDDESLGIDYFEIFECVYNEMKKISSHIKVGGAGIGIQYGRGNLLKLIQAWEKRTVYPDFLSLYCYPYVIGDLDGTQYAKESTDRDFLKNQLSMANELIADSKLKNVEVHVSEWNSTISNRNSMNDSCFKGAYIMKSILDSMDKANVLGYWLGSDIFAEFYDSQILLNGGCGLLSKDGIKKSAFYAFEFLNNLDKYLLGRDMNSILTTSAHNNYSIVCHNYRHLNYKYYLKEEDDISIQKQCQMFEDNEELKIEYEIRNIANGSYQVKIYSVNSENGSVQDEWKKMDLNIQLTKRDVDYLKRICTPRIVMRTEVVSDGTLHLETRLKAQEIQYIHIQYMYG